MSQSSELCMICAIKGQDLVDISYERDKEMCNRFEFLLQIKFDWEDYSISKKFCTVCIHLLSSFSLYFNWCHNVQKMLTQTGIDMRLVDRDEVGHFPKSEEHLWAESCKQELQNDSHATSEDSKIDVLVPILPVSIKNEIMDEEFTGTQILPFSIKNEIIDKEITDTQITEKLVEIHISEESIFEAIKTEFPFEAAVCKLNNPDSESPLKLELDSNSFNNTAADKVSLDETVSCESSNNENIVCSDVYKDNESRRKRKPVKVPLVGKNTYWSAKKLMEEDRRKIRKSPRLIVPKVVPEIKSVSALGDNVPQIISAFVSPDKYAFPLSTAEVSKVVSPATPEIAHTSDEDRTPKIEVLVPILPVSIKNEIIDQEMTDARIPEKLVASNNSEQSFEAVKTELPFETVVRKLNNPDSEFPLKLELDSFSLNNNVDDKVSSDDTVSCVSNKRLINENSACSDVCKYNEPKRKRETVREKNTYRSKNKFFEEDGRKRRKTPRLILPKGVPGLESVSTLGDIAPQIFSSFVSPDNSAFPVSAGEVSRVLSPSIPVSTPEIAHTSDEHRTPKIEVLVPILPLSIKNEIIDQEIRDTRITENVVKSYNLELPFEAVETEIPFETAVCKLNNQVSESPLKLELDSNSLNNNVVDKVSTNETVSCVVNNEKGACSDVYEDNESKRKREPVKVPVGEKNAYRSKNKILEDDRRKRRKTPRMILPKSEIESSSGLEDIVPQIISAFVSPDKSAFPLSAGDVSKVLSPAIPEIAHFVSTYLGSPLKSAAQQSGVDSAAVKIKGKARKRDSVNRKSARHSKDFNKNGINLKLVKKLIKEMARSIKLELNSCELPNRLNSDKKSYGPALKTDLKHLSEADYINMELPVTGPQNET